MTREEETSGRPWERTDADYMQIIRDGQMRSFGEWDNTDAIDRLWAGGMIKPDPNKASVCTTLCISLWFVPATR